MDGTTAYEVILRCSLSYLTCIANKIHHFAAECGMHLHAKKCRALIVNNFLQFQPFSINDLQSMGTVIKQVSSYKILGVYVSDDLTWNIHINYVVKKANKH